MPGPVRDTSPAPTFVRNSSLSALYSRRPDACRSTDWKAHRPLNLLEARDRDHPDPLPSTAFFYLLNSNEPYGSWHDTDGGVTFETSPAPFDHPIFNRPLRRRTGTAIARFSDLAGPVHEHGGPTLT